MYHLKAQEHKIQSLERLKTLESSELALAALRLYISRSTSMFDKYEALKLLQSLIHPARNENHLKTDDNAAMFSLPIQEENVTIIHNFMQLENLLFQLSDLESL